MYIDYLAIMLINLVAALSLGAIYLVFGIDQSDQRRWAPGFGMTGLLFLITGFHLLMTWPLPGSYNIAFGAGAVLFGIVLFGAAVAQALCWDLVTMAIYASFAGLAAVVLGVRIINLKMSQQPLLAGIGYILAGASGLLALPVWYLRRHLWLRVLLAVVLTAAAVIWAITGYGAFWEHLETFAKWAPPTP
jgi:putative membrane protein